MNIDWHLPAEETQITERRIGRVLVEYEDPEIVTLCDQDDVLYLGVAVDEEGDVVRWLESVLYPQKYEALLAGTLGVREALGKPRVWVVDRTREGKPLHAWSLAVEELPEDALPHPGALLPTATRLRLQQSSRRHIS